jgi:hypothetical protein
MLRLSIENDSGFSESFFFAELKKCERTTMMREPSSLVTMTLRHLTAERGCCETATFCFLRTYFHVCEYRASAANSRSGGGYCDQGGALD